MLDAATARWRNPHPRLNLPVRHWPLQRFYRSNRFPGAATVDAADGDALVQQYEPVILL